MLAKYYVTDAHEPIIDRETFKKVQELLKEKKACTPTSPALPSPFTKMLICGGCGKNYNRRTIRSKKVWICPTYNYKGKKFCPISKQIPEETLIGVCCEVLGITEFDEKVFKDRIKNIIVTKPNELLFRFHDGHEQTAGHPKCERKRGKNGSNENTRKQKPYHFSAAEQHGKTQSGGICESIDRF